MSRLKEAEAFDRWAKERLMWQWPYRDSHGWSVVFERESAHN